MSPTVVFWDLMRPDLINSKTQLNHFFTLLLALSYKEFNYSSRFL